jgi:hypothetical protein
MDLPDEIRNRIYEFALTPEDGLAIGIGKLDRLGVPTEATEGILTTWSDNYVDRRTFLHGQHSLTQIKGTRDEIFFLCNEYLRHQHTAQRFLGLGLPSTDRGVVQGDWPGEYQAPQKAHGLLAPGRQSG